MEPLASCTPARIPLQAAAFEGEYLTGPHAGEVADDDEAGGGEVAGQLVGFAFVDGVLAPELPVEGAGGRYQQRCTFADRQPRPAQDVEDLRTAERIGRGVEEPGQIGQVVDQFTAATTDAR